jgi:hypothetical protein
VAHAASKLLRFTPHDSALIGGPTNLQTLCAEFSDLMALIQMLHYEGIAITTTPDAIARKVAKVEDYLNYSKMLGVVMEAKEC